MSNQPLNSNDLAKIFIFSLLQLPILLYLVGLIPVIFLLFGIIMMKRNHDFCHIETAVKNYKIYMYLCMVVGLVVTLYWALYFPLVENDYISYLSQVSFYTIITDRLDETLISFFTSFLPVFYIVIINKLFLSPLVSHREWVEMNGFFSNKENGVVDVIKLEKAEPYSVAGELLKWAKLKEDGHITQEEYDYAKKEILKKN